MGDLKDNEKAWGEELGPAVPPRAFSGCTCECHKGALIFHSIPCCSPRPGFEELNPKLQDEIERVAKWLIDQRRADTEPALERAMPDTSEAVIARTLDEFEMRERGIPQAHIAAKLVAELRVALASAQAQPEPHRWMVPARAHQAVPVVAYRFPKAGINNGYHYVDSLEGEEPRFYERWEALCLATPAAQADSASSASARHYFDAGWKACANFCDRDDVRFDGIVGHRGCPQFEEAFREARKQGGA